MSVVLGMIQRIYAILLRLYPRQFRVEFHEEMQAVFAESLRHAAQAGLYALVCTVLREVLDVPGNALYQHVAAKFGGEAISMRVVYVIRAANSTIGTTLLILTAMYVVFVVLPFYGNGINLHSYAEISGSHVDFKDHAPFVWPLARIPATLFAWLAVLLTPVLTLLLAPFLVVSIGLSWSVMHPGRRLLWIGTLAASSTALLVTWQSIDLIRLWLAD